MDSFKTVKICEEMEDEEYRGPPPTLEEYQEVICAHFCENGDCIKNSDDDDDEDSKNSDDKKRRFVDTSIPTTSTNGENASTNNDDDDDEDEEKYDDDDDKDKDNEHIDFDDEEDDRFSVTSNTCLVCVTKFSCQRNLRRHLKQIHNFDLPYVCQTCSVKFPSYVLLNDHKKTMHKKICLECGIEFQKPSQLKLHTAMRHTKIKEHACSECDNKFYTSSELKKHMPAHTGEKNYKCKAENCEKTYASLPGLRYHEKHYHQLSMPNIDEDSDV